MFIYWLQGFLSDRNIIVAYKFLSQYGIPPGDYPSFEIAEWTPWILGCGFREKDWVLVIYTWVFIYTCTYDKL